MLRWLASCPESVVVGKSSDRKGNLIERNMNSQRELQTRAEPPAVAAPSTEHPFPNSSIGPHLLLFYSFFASTSH